MLVEMQLKSEPIRRMVRNAVKAARICTTASQASYYLDHISVGQPTLRASDHIAPLAGTSGFQTQTLEIHQPADALLVQLSDLQSAPDFAPVSTLTPASVDIVVSVTLSIHQSGSKKGQPRFSVALVTVNGTNALGSLLAPNLQGQVQFNQTADLDLSALTSLPRQARSRSRIAASRPPPTGRACRCFSIWATRQCRRMNGRPSWLAASPTGWARSTGASSSMRSR